MKAITLHQPWASLIAAGAKTMETRSWSPPIGLIGKRLAIHAAASPVVHGLPGDVVAAVSEALGYGWTQSIRKDRPAPKGSLPRGAILCTVRVAGAYRVGPPDGNVMGLPLDAQFPGSEEPGIITPDMFGDYSTGRWLWKLDGLEVLPEPISFKGGQGLWNWEP